MALFSNTCVVLFVVSESANSYVKLMEDLEKMVTRMVFENYGVERYNDPHREITSHLLGLIKYAEPDQKTRPSIEGLPTHTDKGFISILHTNHVKGLEIKTKDGELIGFDPSPTSFILLAADAFQVWSNDRIRSCKHRVMLIEDESRYTIGLFAFQDGTIHLPEELVDEEHPLKYKPFNGLEFLNAQFRKAGQNGQEMSVEAYCGI
ncbi:putative 2-oxoglutarate-dependent dioxygenase AOP1 [Morella rubra]|uniref:Putative 2-oxoglutarate-dependent dioxygenase AOP1 n=1 Tax=Morella rubra TaxID=262757 RepID=A0A6A1VN63_9ROSI|nr:putative 2-oxoglutarate-dependent dioxygenase AOP1 [Morella rubra]